MSRFIVMAPAPVGQLVEFTVNGERMALRFLGFNANGKAILADRDMNATMLPRHAHSTEIVSADSDHAPIAHLGDLRRR